MLYIVLPVRNEAQNIEAVLEGIGPALANYNAPYRVLVVDGASTDGTPKVVRRQLSRHPVDVVELRHDCGQGGALEAALRTVLSDCDTIVTLAGDGTHDPRTIYPMLGRIAEGYEVVIASRFPPAGRPGLSARALSRWLRRRFPMGNVTDYTCGFRAYRARALQKVKKEHGRMIEESSSACHTELLLRLRTVGAQAAEVPFAFPAVADRSWTQTSVARHLNVIRRARKDAQPE